MVARLHRCQPEKSNGVSASAARVPGDVAASRTACYGECVTDDVGVLMLEQLKGLRGDVTGLRGDVGGLRGEVTGLRGDVAGVRDEVRVTNARLEKVEDTLQDLAAQMPILARFVRNIGEKYDRELEGIKDRLGRLESKRDV